MTSWGMENNSFKFVYKQTEKFGHDPSANPHLFEVFILLGNGMNYILYDLNDPK